MSKILLVVVLFFTGCAYKAPYTTSKPYFIVIKNSQIAVADTGFIKKNESTINLQLFSASTPILDLHVGQMVCINRTCVSKKRFNVEFFGYTHYESFVDEIFRLKPIYDKKNLKKIESGFEQKIETENFDITYRVEGKNLYFRDRKNRVLVRLKELR